MIAIGVLLNVESDYVPAFREQTFRPPAEAAKQVYRQRHLPS